MLSKARNQFFAVGSEQSSLLCLVKKKRLTLLLPSRTTSYDKLHMAITKILLTFHPGVVYALFPLRKDYVYDVNMDIV